MHAFCPVNQLFNKITDVAVSRDLTDYVITECWRDVEQALPGETYILPIWQAWSTARNEVSALEIMSIFILYFPYTQHWRFNE